MEEKVKAAPPMADAAKDKSTQPQERKSLDKWAADSAIGPFKPGTENHRCMLAGLRHVALQRRGAVDAELTKAEFDAVCAELTNHPIGYRVGTPKIHPKVQTIHGRPELNLGGRKGGAR